MPISDNVIEDSEEAVSEPTHEFGPSVDVLARRISTLKKKWKDTIAMVCLHGEREMDLVAKKLDIEYNSLFVRMRSIYITLGINTLEPATKKVLLRNAWTRFMEMNGTARVTQAPEVTAQSEPELQDNSPGNRFGAGVVIPLPPDLVNVDVVSGLFNGGKPSRDMAEAVRGRKSSGLKPAYLVLSPSGIDPEITLAQLVFFQKEHD